jgi:general secretion pathway protein D
MNELGSYQAKPAVPAAVTPAPAAEKPAAVAATKSAPVAVAAAPVAEKPPESVDVPAVVEKSRSQYVAGDYAGAEEGFCAALKADPGNKIAAFYLREMDSLVHRAAEEARIEEVDKEWGTILRYYRVTDRFVKSMKLEGVEQSVDVKPQLLEAEVKFPAGSSARYVPEFHKLFVKNTPANLAKLEEVLAAFGAAEDEASAEQVKIETRFVEYNEGALQELGFNWSDAADGDTFNKGDWAVKDGQNLFSGALRGMPPDAVPFSKTGSLGLGEEGSRIAMGDRLDNGTANRLEDMFNSNAGTLELSGSIAGNAVNLLISALDQTAGADVLSAPSVVTRSGEPATITVGERHFYPESYAAGESQGTVLHVKYEDFKEKILGVEMTVTPTIKGDDIQMKINPKINELLGWQRFQLAPADSSYTYYQYRVGMQFEHDSVIAQLPLFNRREVKTEISVASGSTIGMGGLIGEKTESFSDRVPVLGSIPLVGRLFRSEGSRTVKRNLMIFVTASKVAPNGRILSEKSFEK